MHEQDKALKFRMVDYEENLCNMMDLSKVHHGLNQYDYFHAKPLTVKATGVQLSEVEIHIPCFGIVHIVLETALFISAFPNAKAMIEAKMKETSQFDVFTPSNVRAIVQVRGSQPTNMSIFTFSKIMDIVERNPGIVGDYFKTFLLK